MNYTNYKAKFNILPHLNLHNFNSTNTSLLSVEESVLSKKNLLPMLPMSGRSARIHMNNDNQSPINGNMSQLGIQNAIQQDLISSSSKKSMNSLYTILENQRLTRSMEKLDILFRKKSVEAMDRYSKQSKAVNSKEMSEEYRIMANKIRSIISPDIEQSKVLKENAMVNNEIFEGETAYYRVKCEGKKPPLRILIGRNRGEVACFISRFTEKPSMFEHEAMFSGDNYSFSPLGHKFDRSFVFLAVHARRDASYSIVVKFQRLFENKTESPRSRGDNVEKGFNISKSKFRKQTEDDIETSIPKQDFLAKISIGSDKRRTLIQSYKARTANCSPIPRDYVGFNKRENEKVERALQRKKEIEEEEFERKLLLLHRKQIREMEKEEEELKIAERNKKIQFDTSWLSVYIAFQGLSRLSTAFQEQKKKAEHEQKTLVSTVRIQQEYRKLKHTIDKNPNRRTLLMGLYLMRAQANITDKTVTDRNKRIMVDFLVERRDQRRMNALFIKYFESIVKIQRRIKQQLANKKGRVHVILLFWNKLVNRLCYVYFKSDEEQKKLLSDIDPAEYHKISSETKCKLSELLYREKFEEYCQRFEKYREDLKNASGDVLRASKFVLYFEESRKRTLQQDMEEIEKRINASVSLKPKVTVVAKKKRGKKLEKKTSMPEEADESTIKVVEQKDEVTLAYENFILSKTKIAIMPPTFDYLPTIEEMKKLLQAGLNM